MSVVILSQADCPVCSNETEIKPESKKEDRMTCFCCGASLKITNLAPPTLCLAYDDPEMERRFWKTHRTIWNDWW